MFQLLVMKNLLQSDTLRYSSQFIQDKVALPACVTSCHLGSQKVEFELSFLENHGPWWFFKSNFYKIQEATEKLVFAGIEGQFLHVW